jgi:GT2 family glycosyltransferase
MVLDVSIVVVNWNAKPLLRDCLRSISDQTRIPHEIIVIDNASHDGSTDMVRCEYPNVVLVANPDNRGFAAANNQGIALAKGRYILLLNPDTLILAGAIDKTVAFADARPGIGCVGCQVLEDAYTIQKTCFGFPSPLNTLLTLSQLAALFPRSRVFGRQWMGWWDRTSEREVDVVSGMYMLIPRTVIEDIGPMDDDYFVYAEEADLCYRMALRGYPRVFTPCAQIIHREGGGQSTALVSVRMYVQLQKSLLLYHRKNLGLTAWGISKTLFVLAMAARGMATWAAIAFGGGERAMAKSTQSWAALRYHLQSFWFGRC